MDVARFEQVLGNLISNAVKYGEPEGEIGIELATQGSQFRVSIVNTGGGIPPGEIPTLFERFARGRTTRGNGVPGLGLGLYICRGLIEGSPLRFPCSPKPLRPPLANQQHPRDEVTHVVATER